jgi:Na+/H+-dicarboxylate symporter
MMVPLSFNRLGLGKWSAGPMVLKQVGLPVEGIALIIGDDSLLDMVRTAVNVTGDAHRCMHCC